MEFSILIFDDGGNWVFQGKILGRRSLLEKCEIVIILFLESIGYNCGLICCSIYLTSVGGAVFVGINCGIWGNMQEAFDIWWPLGNLI